jgi:hypothetical protein
VTQRFTPALTAAVSKLLTMYSTLGENQRFISALATPFDLLGAAIGAAVDRLPAFVDWMTQVLSRENIVNVLSNVAGWIQAVSDKVTTFIAAALGKDGFSNLWEAFGAAARAGIDIALRAWNGFTAMVLYFVANRDVLFGAISDAFKGVRDAATQFGDTVKGVFDGIVAGADTAIGALLAVGDAFERLLENAHKWGLNPITQQNALFQNSLGIQLPGGIARRAGPAENSPYQRPGQWGEYARAGRAFRSPPTASASGQVGVLPTSPLDRAAGFFKGLGQAGAEGWSHGIDDLEAEAKRRAEATKAALNRALGPGVDADPLLYGETLFHRERRMRPGGLQGTSVTRARGGPETPTYPGGMLQAPPMAPLAPNMPFVENADGSFAYPNQRADDIYARQRGAATLQIAVEVNMADMGQVASQIGAAVTQRILDHLREQQNEAIYGYGF